MTCLRRRVIVFASFLLLLIGYFGLIQPPGRPRKLDRFLIRRRANATVGSRTVVVYDRNKFHDEVHGAVLWTLSQFDDVRVVFYRREWRFQFEQVISSFWPTEMEPRDPGLFILDMWADHSVRDVILTTCDWDLQYIVDDLEKIWGAREDEEKFNVICLRHWPGDGPIKDLEFFVRQGAMSQLGLGDHVGQSIEKSKEQAIKHFSRTEGNEETIEAIPNIRTRTFVPMFPPDLPERDEPARTAMTKGELSLALIQSSFWNEQHRAIKATFDTLEAALHADPSIWGYAPPATGEVSFIPLPPSPDSSPPFQLIALGSGGLGIPPSLTHVVKLQKNKPYPEFYSIMSAADLVLPAFGYEGYDLNRASSTIGSAATAKVPMLSSPNITDAYGYFCPAFKIERPADMQEMEFVRQARAGERPWRTRKEMLAALEDCQEEWTVKNMVVLAELFRKI